MIQITVGSISPGGSPTATRVPKTTRDVAAVGKRAGGGEGRLPALARREHAVARAGRSLTASRSGGSSPARFASSSVSCSPSAKSIRPRRSASGRCRTSNGNAGGVLDRDPCRPAAPQHGEGSPPRSAGARPARRSSRASSASPAAARRPRATQPLAAGSRAVVPQPESRTIAVGTSSGQHVQRTRRKPRR